MHTVCKYLFIQFKNCGDIITKINTNRFLPRSNTYVNNKCQNILFLPQSNFCNNSDSHENIQWFTKGRDNSRNNKNRKQSTPITITAQKSLAKM